MSKNHIRFFPRFRPRRGTLPEEGGQHQRYCPNCHYPLPHYGEFCSNCSQRYTDGRIPLKFLLQDFVDSVFNLDSKFFRTTWSLVVPGRLTNEFFKGHHKRYASPSRLFFIATVVHFAILGFVINDNLQEGVGQFNEKSRRQAYMLPLFDSLQQARRDILPLYEDDPKVASAMDTLLHRVIKERQDTQSISFMYLDKHWDFQSREVKVGLDELYGMRPDELADAYNIGSGMERFMFVQSVKVATQVDNFTQFAIGQLVWMVILMMPALALILKLLYVRRKRYFVEHLVFSFHYHAFAFWVLSIALLVGLLAESQSVKFDAEDYAGPIFLVILIYLFIAMKRVYRQGIFKTFFKFFILNFSYLFLFILFLTLTLAVSLVLF